MGRRLPNWLHVLVRVIIAALALLAAGGLLTAPSTAEAPARAVASATLVDGSSGRIGSLRASGDDGRRSASVSAEERAVSIDSGELVVRTSLAGGDGRAEAGASARSIDLLGGLVTAYGLRRRTVARDGGRSHEGRVEGLAIDGRMIGTVTEQRFYDVRDVGTLAVNRGATALKVTLTRSANGFPAGTTVSVGRVRAEAEDGADPAATPTPTATPEPERDEPEDEKKDGDGGEKKKAKDAGEKEDKPAKDRKLKRRRAPKVAERLTANQFAFPVYGKATIGGPFGAPRQIGAHQGNDVFAPFGAPVLAVTSGELFNVGTKKISGNRLWLRSDAGDEFFYAHLSAFSPAAVNGRRVEAGEVLGFTGNTGDAEPTPPHVHFEIHPGGGDAIDPRPFLEAWQDRRDVPPGAWLTRYGSDTEERPGALVEVRDFIAGE